MLTIPDRYVKVKSLEFYGQAVHIYVDSEDGVFAAFDDNGKQFRNSRATLDRAIWAARGSLRRTLANVEIPFRTKDGKRGNALNIHDGNGNVTIQFSGEDKKQQIDTYYASSHFYKAETTDEQIAEADRLQRLINERQAQLNTLQQEIVIDLGVAVKTAVDAQIRAADEASWGVATPAEPDDEDDDEDEF
jgi:hypothetical protein